MRNIVRLIIIRSIVVIGSFLFAAFLAVTTANANPQLTCKTFDTWYLSDGGTKFDYKVTNGEWNLPADLDSPISTITLQNTGIWEYMSDEDQAKYFIVFLSFEPSGDPLGQHNICVYRVPYVQ